MKLPALANYGLTEAINLHFESDAANEIDDVTPTAAEFTISALACAQQCDHRLL